MKLMILSLLACALAGCASTSQPPHRPESVQPTPAPSAAHPAPAQGSTMQLGNFSVSLNVKDLSASRAFYEKLGFKSVGGNGKNWSIMQNDTVVIGLFQGMFEKNILTFNPGWDRERNTPSSFTDVRELQRDLAGKGITPVTKADEATTGPASFVIVDPDGNPILFDQHVPAPKK